MFLNDKEILKLIREKDLIRNYRDLSKQIQPNGFDLTVGQIFKFSEGGIIDFSNLDRRIPETETIKLNPVNEVYYLKQGSYKVEYNEIIKLPKNLCALSIHRSSMLRCGITVETGVWDAGYEGRGKTLLVVHNEYGLVLTSNAKIAQMLFIPINEAKEIYKGIYQKEGV